MIITIKGADFSSANIGTLSTYIISKSIGSGAAFDIPNFVDKNSSVNWTITLDEGYTFGTYSVTMGGAVITPTVVDNVMTISIAEVTGNVRIVVATVNENTGEEDEPTIPDEPVVPPVDPEEPDVPTPDEPVADLVYVTDVPHIVDNFRQGSYTKGGLTDEPGRIRAGYFNAVGKQLHMTLYDNWYGYVCYQTTESHILIGSKSWTQDELFVIPQEATKVLIVLKNDTIGDITPSDYIDGVSGHIVFENIPEKTVVTTYDASYFTRGGLTVSSSQTNVSEFNRVRTDLLDCQSEDIIQVTLPENMICYVAYKSLNDASMQHSDWLSVDENGVVKVTMPYTGKFCVVVAYSDKNTEFESDASDFTGHVDILR